MPLGLDASERKLLAICGGVLLLLVTATAILAPADEYAGSKIPSTYSPSSDGAEAAYLLLEQLRYHGVPSELILAEWDPPADRARIRDILKLPYPGTCAVRIVEVPGAGESEAIARNAAARTGRSNREDAMAVIYIRRAASAGWSSGSRLPPPHGARHFASRA